MIYMCADDYGLCECASMRILKCVDAGALNKVSVFPNFGTQNTEALSKKKVELSLHLNVVEGRALSNPDKISLIADSDGLFRHTFGGLFALSFIKGREFENQIYEELKAQLKWWRDEVGDVPVMIDSHQHTHMIPGVFRALMRAIDDGNYKVRYLRLPCEPVMPYVLTPSLYMTYRPVNIIKQWLLKLLGVINKKECKKRKIPVAYFFGILFSGKMDEKRVERILPHYITMAEKSGCDTEVLFHPGYMEKGEKLPDVCNRDFEKFYYSSGRKTEYDAVMNFKYKKSIFKISTPQPPVLGVKR